MKTTLMVLSTLLVPISSFGQTLPVAGYYTQADQLVFEFNTLEHQYAVQSTDGNVIPTSSLTIFSVALAGRIQWLADQRLSDASRR